MPRWWEFSSKKSGVALVAIGIFKLAKSVSLFALGAALIHWRGQDLGQVAAHWINTLWIARPFVERLISKLSAIDEKTLEHVAAGLFTYSALLLIEGVGLCRKKRWAEFLTVGITASLLPLEFYELSRHPSAISILITLVNIAILCYLVVRLMRERAEFHPAPAKEEYPPKTPT